MANAQDVAIDRYIYKHTHVTPVIIGMSFIYQKGYTDSLHMLSVRNWL